MKKYNLTQRFTALALALIMIWGLLPQISLPSAANAATLTDADKVVDNSSFSNWQNYYGKESDLPGGGTGISTWKAGGVWTDKSVYGTVTGLKADPIINTQVPQGHASIDDITMIDRDNNFLVALSALASNQEIVGQSTTPTDTILVLDMSSSMWRWGDNVTPMVQAANETIHELMKMNDNNRVGIVMYAGSDDGVVFLPLDHYSTTLKNSEGVGQYLRVTSGNGWNSGPTVHIITNNQGDNDERGTVTGSVGGTIAYKSVQCGTGTYIQDGLNRALDLFEGSVNKNHTPIVVLMSDGAPTRYHRNYYDTPTSGVSTDNDSGNTITFLTQLSAAYVKAEIKTLYGKTPLFYTLGLNTSSSASATAVLNPTGSSNTLRNYWNTFNNATGTTVDVAGVDNLTVKTSAQGGMNYVDSYFAAADGDEMIAAFKEIVADIALQSATSATLVQSGDANLDGYITVQDELGAMMQVRDVKGILLGSTLYSGAEFAKALNTNSEGGLGSGTAPSALGDEFIRSGKERLGISTTEAQQLVMAAFADEQLLPYNSSTGNYSNYIGWYSGTVTGKTGNDNYIGFWDKDTGFDPDAGHPTNAKYINQSYVYLGDADHGHTESDMMHISVRVRTEIATGHQTVFFAIPSALIPMVTYHVDLQGADLATATTATLTVTENDPIRLVYEVGLPADVNSVNLEAKVQEWLNKGDSDHVINHVHKDDDGNYVFYANSWGVPVDSDTDGILEDGEVSHDVADMIADGIGRTAIQYLPESHFIPNTSNPRFYILEDTPVLDANGNHVSSIGTGNYYFERLIVTATGAANNAAEVEAVLEQLQPATLANSNNFKTIDGKLYVKGGTIRQQLSNVVLPKEAEGQIPANPTGTIANTDQLWVYIPAANAGQQNQPTDFNIYSFLGNNGKLTVTPATGIAVTKNVTEYADGHDATTPFAMKVTLTPNATYDIADIRVTDENGTAITADVTAGSGTIEVTFSLVNGETAYITGMPAGTAYTVTEDQGNAPLYTATLPADGTAAAGVITPVTVTNTPIKEGSLYITKEVVHAITGETVPAGRLNDEFTFTVDFGSQLTGVKVTKTGETQASDLTIGGDGKATITLKHGQTAMIDKIPAGTTVTVVETEVSDDNYTLKGYIVNGGALGAANTVEIVSDVASTVVAQNEYKPLKSDAVSVTVNVSKTLKLDANPNQDMKFDFVVEEWSNGAWNTSSPKATFNDVGWGSTTDALTQAPYPKEVTKTSSNTTLTFGPYENEGTHIYRIRELPGSVAGLTYDPTEYVLTVTVADVNGKLVATVKDNHNATVANNGTYTAAFTNEFHTAPVSINIVKEIDDTSNNPLTSKAGFGFKAVLQTINGVAPGSDAENVELTVYSDANGNATMTATYKTAGTYVYTVTEVSTATNGWTFSDDVYTVTVTVAPKVAGSSDLAATIAVTKDAKTDNEGEATAFTVNGSLATIYFKNKYDPEDGTLDMTHNVPKVFKNLDGRDFLATDVFEFGVFLDGTSQYEKTNALLIGTVSGATGSADVAATFAANNATSSPFVDVLNNKLKFTQVGTYRFDIVEFAGTLGGVTYDPTVYKMVVEVTDNNGQLVASHYFENSTDDKVTFTNTYTTTPANVVIDGKKILDVQSGYKALNAGDYTFKLYLRDDQGNPTGNALRTATNLANGTFRFDAIEYTAADIDKTFEYVVVEVDEGKPGITYSQIKYPVNVTVTDKGNGTLETTVTGNGAANIAFTNTYNSTAASVDLTGKKTLSGRELTNNDNFLFQLYTATDATFANRTVMGDPIALEAATGATLKDTLHVNLPNLGMGYHYYVLKEVVPEGADRAPGIHYDTTEYHITVQVVDSGTGQMTALTTVTKTGSSGTVGTDALNFTNVYQPNPGALPIGGTKTYTGGKALEDGVFKVELYERVTDDATNQTEDVLLQTVDVKAKTATQATDDGWFQFELIEYDHNDVGKTFTYIVKEATAASNNISYDRTEYVITVTVKDDTKDGVLEIERTIAKVGANSSTEVIAFENAWTPDPIGHTIEATKTYEKGLTGGDFEFQLVDADDKTTVDMTAKNDENGKIQFVLPNNTFTQAGEYKFTVKELRSGFLFVKHSVAEYEVTVTVVMDPVTGELTAAVTNIVNTKNTGETNLEFKNTYIYDGEGSVVLSGTKELTGDRTTVNAGEFEFGLYDENGNLIESVKNDADGKFTFTLKYDEAVDVDKNYTYTVKEIAGDNTRYTYDDTVYEVVVAVKDNDQGGIAVNYTVNGKPDAKIEFTNTYKNPTPVTYTPSAKKEYNKELAGGEFQFKLEGKIGDKNVSQTVSNKADGTIVFDALSFPEAGTYTFKVKEIEKLLGFIEYSTAEYTLVVEIIDTKGTLSLGSVTVNNVKDGAISFTNTYKLDGEGEVTLRGTKTLTGDRTAANAGEFTFALYDADGKLIETVKNDANGEFAFATLKFDESHTAVDGKKTYTYTVKEIAGDDPCMTYDAKTYTVVITVEDNDEGGVKATYTVDGKADTKIAFTNTYTAPEDVMANITIQKVVESKSEDAIGPKDFTFVLKHGDNTYTDISDENGKAGFQIALGVNDIGKTYEFEVYEKKGSVDGVTYDTTVYNVVVEVSQNEDGSIKTVINGKDATGVDLTFTNVYEVPTSPDTGDNFPTMLIGTLLVLSGAALVALLFARKKSGKHTA